MGRLWQSQEENRLVWMLDVTGNHADVAKALGRTELAVVQYRIKKHIPAPCRSGYTVTGLARLLNLYWTVVKRLARQGAFGLPWLVGRTRRRVYSRENVEDFLTDPAYWHEYDPEQLADPLLVEIGRESRGAVQFYTLLEAGEQLGITSNAVLGRIRHGAIKAVWRYSNGTGGCWLIRNDWLNEAKKFEPKRSTSQRRFSPDEDYFLTCWRPYQPIGFLAAALERPGHSVRDRCRRLGLTGPVFSQRERATGRRYKDEARSAPAISSEASLGLPSPGQC